MKRESEKEKLASHRITSLSQHQLQREQPRQRESDCSCSSAARARQDARDGPHSPPSARPAGRATACPQVGGPGWFHGTGRTHFSRWRLQACSRAETRATYVRRSRALSNDAILITFSSHDISGANVVVVTACNIRARVPGPAAALGSKSWNCRERASCRTRKQHAIIDAMRRHSVCSFAG